MIPATSCFLFVLFLCRLHLWVGSFKVLASLCKHGEELNLELGDASSANPLLAFTHSSGNQLDKSNLRNLQYITITQWDADPMSSNYN